MELKEKGEKRGDRGKFNKRQGERLKKGKKEGGTGREVKKGEERRRDRERG